MRTCLTRSTSPMGLWLAFVALLATPALLASPVAAQSFDDEFDDAFADQERDSTTTTTTTTTTSELQPGDLAADEFGDTETPETPVASTPPASGPEGRATDARGDLLSANGSRAWRHRRFALHNTWGGSVGGIHVVDAGSGPSQTFRVSLMTDFFFQNGFLGPADDHSHIGGSLSLSWTPFDFIEIYASIASYANSNLLESPQLFQVLGDTLIGAKGYYEVVPWLTLGGDVSVALLNTVGDIGLVLNSTSIGVRLNATMDLRALEGVEFPLIARLNLQYYVDNSGVLTDSVEHARYDALPTSGPDARRPYNDEDRQLLSRVERFALGINRTDFFNIGIGVELPFEAMPDFFISPILEWVVAVPVNRQGYNCLFIPATPGGTTPVAGTDGCLEHQGFAAMPSTLTLGVRVQPPIRGLGITLAADIGTSGMNTFVREIAPNAPYDVILGLSYAYDTMPVPAEVREVSVERQVEVRIPPPPRGRVIGTVVTMGTTTPVSGALVSFPGRDFTTLSTGSDGHFTSSELDPGEVSMTITHSEHHDGSCSATVPADGGDVTVTCELEALPAVGIVQGHVVSDTGGAIGGATVQVTGPQAFTLVTSPSGEFMRQDLPPGVYTARVDAENFLITQAIFTVVPRETVTPEITAIARPTRSLVRVSAREIFIRRQINFATDSSDILPTSLGLLSEIADVLLRHPEIARVEIQGHTDNRGGHDHNQDLSQRRAESVRTWLMEAGVDGSRLEAHGYGDTNPIAPNITAGGRARNRRVQFIIQERAAE